MISPAMRHRENVKAASEQKTPQALPDLLGREARESRQKTQQQVGLMTVRLMDDVRKLSTIRSRSARNEYKKTLIPHYLDHLMSVINRGRLSVDNGDRSSVGKPDLVLATVCVWCFDAEDYRHGLPLFEYAVEMQLPSPERFKSSLIEIIVRTLSETVIRRSCRSQQPTTEALGIVQAVFELVDGADMADEVRSGLYRAYASVNHSQRPEVALNYYRQAVEVNPKMGLRRVINRLEKTIGEKR